MIQPLLQRIAFTLCCPLICCIFPTTASAVNLPQIGDTTSSNITLEDEYQLGKTWARVLRAQTRQMYDPQVFSYVNNLLQSLASNSQLSDKRLTLIMVKNPTLNAFAVPGGVIGVHGGLLRYAESESQFASVLAHEISHLSQRHYARSLDEQRKNLPLLLASMVGGIIVAANSDGDEGQAAIASSQAAYQSQRLAFSRQNEREADNIGMQVLIDSGFKARAMPEMFQGMQRATRLLGDRPPEFLLTHPVTESRIADSLGRAAQLPSSGREDSLEYQIIRVRSLVELQKDHQVLVDRFKHDINSEQTPRPISHYALALSAIHTGDYQTAATSLDWLLDNDADNDYYQMLQYELWIESGQAEQARQALKKQLQIYPNHHALTMLYIDSLKKLHDYQGAARQLHQHLKLYPDHEELWFELAEVSGLSNDIVGLHRARAEYFLLQGATQKAEEHYQLLLRSPRTSDTEKAVIRSRLKDVMEVRKQLE